MQRLFVALHGTPGSYLRDVLQEGSADAVACLPVPRAKVFSSFLLFAWWVMLLFLVIILCLIAFKCLRSRLSFFFGNCNPHSLQNHGWKKTLSSHLSSNICN
jgi:hypothetical protein